ncbi:hypothetical protein OCH239_01310 [Roseivivax halodurans JCM 10272]|uniref:Polysaccharide export protein N-terminal domain-containing protein n=1 Tax=Roseivivax halodurans JCM 10272 TaxID=1449350 RepID=X7ELB8_9RHOB|nr:polysaccharide biosynthesis/export family protein [Roseivivax halodurans]ETX16727.1 hypothetical protein OCH239_01310 [Roseivivax halodurans JCM 10272]
MPNWTIRALALLLIALAPGAGIAQTGAEMPKLAAGDVLSFSIVGLPDTRREVPVGGDGSVFLPLVGTLTAGGRTIAEFREALEAHLRGAPMLLPMGGDTNARRGVSASEILVDVVRYRPIYVSGDSALVGDIEFRPGMTIRQAWVMAGGPRRLEDENGLRMAETLARQDAAREEIMALRADIERLTADLEALAAPGDVGASDAEDGPETALGTTWLQARLDARESARETTATQLEILGQREDKLVELQEVSAETVRVAERNLERVRDLADRGVATATAQDDARYDLLQFSSRALETSENLLELRVEIARLRESLESEEAEAQIDLLERIEEKTSDLREAEAQYRTLQSYLATYEPEGGDERTPPQVRLFRTSSDGTTPRSADLDEPVMPGDVLEFTLRASEAAIR